MKINIIANSFPATSETFLFNLVTELEKKGHDVTVCAFSRQNNIDVYSDRIHKWSRKIVYSHSSSPLQQLIAAFQTLTSPLLLLKLIRKNGFRTGYSNLLKIRFLCSNQPQIIHFAFSGIAANMLPVLDLIPNNIKLIVSCRGTAEKVTAVTDKIRAERLGQVFAKSHLIHCVSQDMMIGLKEYGLDENKAFVNYPSISTTQFTAGTERKTKTPNDLYTVVTTGRLNFIKGYPYAIGAIDRLVNKGYKIKYKIIGDGPDFDMLQYMIREKNLESIVELTGKISSTEVLNHLKHSDIFLLPSLSEGVSNAALEAMSLEIPTVSTKAGGMPEVIEHGLNGLLVNRFSEEEIANALQQVMENYAHAIEMGRNARQSVKQKFTLDKQIALFEEQYRKLI